MLNKFTFLIDVDGVLTSGKFFYNTEGKIIKEFGPHDSYSLSLLKDKLNIEFISADHRGFEISNKRVQDMGFELKLVSETERINYIKENYDLNLLIFMGDSDVDAQVFNFVKFGIAPDNARPEAKKNASYITNVSGGEGAVAEACDWIKENILN